MGKEFNIMKKTLDLAIATGRYEELYEIHINLTKKIEMQILTKDSHNILDDNSTEFAATISNPIGIHSKVWKPKDTNQNSFKKVNLGVDNLISQENLSRHCGICGQVGHNARTCNLDSSSNRIINTNQKCYSDQNYDLPLSITKHSKDSNLVDVYVGDKDSINNKLHHCGACG
ncbi:hypothetical protein C2G38_2026739 [Gigaspora rosea]|uniref:CCHC-type domain-containing protein n=1 Tax=Gigaspora rosea TaxID=44941 RepID=A0A397WDQ8_9GLOM|nr:hypothetical protein C2G38_2026739 [Gigaspora rosea]